MSKKIQALHTKWAAKNLEVIETTSKLQLLEQELQVLASNLQTEIQKSTEALLKYSPTTSVVKNTPTPNPTYTRQEIADLLGYSVSQISEYWPNPTNIATLEEINTVLISLGKRPIDPTL